MKKNTVLILVGASILLLFILYFFFSPAILGNKEKNNTYFLPKVLILTTGSSQGNGVLPQGVVIALQTFNKEGALVRLDSRNILLDSAKLKEFNIMILPTSIDYHDADRKYSLTFLSDEEMLNIKNWVKKGGVLIAGDNIGRNTLENVDRISTLQKLTPANWVLGECFGVSLKEKNIQGFHMEGNINSTVDGTFINTWESEQWLLVPDSVYSTAVKPLAYWVNDKGKIPALIENAYGKGLSFLLPSFYLLHPANDGGYLSSEEIQAFYENVLNEFYKQHTHRIRLNPWPSANDYAFCVTLNAAGDKQNFERVLSFLDKEKISPTIFANGWSGHDMREFILGKELNIQSNGFSRTKYKPAHYPLIIQDILSNENYWKKKFTGFRFPFTHNSFWGMISLSEGGYHFDSSIGADNINSYYGSVFPYNIPVSHDTYYKTLDMLEISPALNDDYHFYKSLTEIPIYNKEQQEKDALLFEKYLNNYWQYAVKPYNGAMVFIGHPLYTGYNDTTMIPLENLVKKVKSEHTWITTIDEIADYWSGLGKLRFNIIENKNEIIIQIDGPKNIKLNELSLKLDNKPLKIEIKEGKYDMIERNNQVYIIFTACSGQEINLEY